MNEKERMEHVFLLGNCCTGVCCTQVTSHCRFLPFSVSSERGEEQEIFFFLDTCSVLVCNSLFVLLDNCSVLVCSAYKSQVTEVIALFRLIRER